MATMAMPTTQLPSGESMALMGQGTWHLGVGRHPAQEEIAALRLGLSLGMTVVDTAEMYGDGASERLVGRALAGRRDSAFLVSKVLPHHATRRGAIDACERSLRRLDTDHLDLYLLHWRGQVPLEETVEAFDALLAAGWIRHWGVSNFDVGDMAELLRVRGGTGVDCDQVLFNLAHRSIESALMPWCRSIGVPVMAYSPIEHGRLALPPVVARIAARHGATAAQVALAWVLLHDGVSAIPEAGTREHVAENRAALDVRLTVDDVEELDEAFPPPAGPRPLEVS
jgi:diketogulonate reductase-like aldo/keto reductase